MKSPSVLAALLEHERELGELLRSSAALERELATWLEPCLELRRRELVELREKLGEAVDGARPRRGRDASAPRRTGATPAEVAVVLPCFNFGPTVEEALASVLAQSRPPSEVCIVDDGSTDLSTRQVLVRLRNRGYRVVRRPHRGPSAARNLAVRSTRAPFVAVVEADAVLEPAFLEEAAALLEERPELGFVCCGADESFSADESLTADLVGVVSCLGSRILSLARRQVWEAVGGYDEDLEGYVEADFLARALEQGFQGEVLRPSLVSYPARRDTLYGDARYVDAAGAGVHLRWMESFYARHGATVERYGGELVRARERFVASQRRRQERLGELKEKAERELEELETESGAARLRLYESGRQPIDWGDLRRTAPWSHFWGLDRGRPVDRVYVEAFLQRHRSDVRGRVLEIHDPGYTVMIGGDQVEHSDVLDIHPGPEATIVADLAQADAVPDATFDCFILTQTLNVIYDVRGALWHACRVLKPGGVLLCTVSALNRVTYGPGGREADYWRFTEASLRQLFAELVPVEAFEVTPYGNVLACVAFLYGMASHELTDGELDQCDPYFPLIYGVRVVKPGEGGEGE